MAAKVTIELDDNVSGPLKSVARSAAQTGNDFDELDSSVSALQAEIEELKSSMLDLAAANAKAASSNDGVASSGANVAQKITAISTGTLAVIEVTKKLAETGKKAYELLKVAAENGNPAAKELVKSVEGLGTALADVANDPLFQDFLNGMAETINSTVVPAIKGIPDAWRGTQDWIAGAITATTDFVGVTQGATSELAQMNEQSAKGIELRKKATAAAAEKAKADKLSLDLNKDLEKIEEAKRQTAMKTALANVKDLAVLEERAKTEKQALKDLAAAGTLADSEKAKWLSDIVAVEGRILELKNEQTEVAKKQVEQTKAWWEGLKGAQKTLEAATSTTWSKMTAEAKKNVDAVVAKEKAAIDSLVAKLNELKGQDGKSADVVNRIRDKIDPRDLAKKIGDNRAKPLDDQAKAEDEQQRKLQHDLNRLRQSRQAVKAGGGWEYDPARQQQIQKMDEEEAALEQKLRESNKKERGFKQGAAGERQKAFKQAAAGGEGISAEEIAKAQDQMTSAVIDQAVATGQLTQTQEKALRAAASATMEQAKVMRQQAEDIEEIITVLDGITDGTKKIGQKKRAQRGSAGG